MPRPIPSWRSACLHCRERVACKPPPPRRCRLCSVCYRDRAVRALYFRQGRGRQPLPLDTPGRTPCRHCRERVAGYPAGGNRVLCSRCYCLPEVRAAHVPPRGHQGSRPGRRPARA